MNSRMSRPVGESLSASASDGAKPTTAIGKHPCPECGANLEWDADKQALVCPYCGTIAPWSPAVDVGDGSQGGAVIEYDLEQALRYPATSRNWGAQRKEVKCQNCHAISVFVDGKVAKRCDFCGSPAIVAHEDLQDAITPQSLLPFKVSEAQVRSRIRQWYGSRWFAPNRLRTAALTDTLHGVYVPYWTFDAHANAQWRADAGHYYYETVTFRDSNGQMQTRQERRVRWVPAAGQLGHFFDDTLVPGTVGVGGKLLRKVEPFPTRTDLKVYSPEYVRGWTVERYQVDLRRAASLGQAQMDAELQTLCAQRVPGDTYRNLQVQTHYSGRTFKHVLVPVWVVSYTYGAKSYQIVANGYSGQIAGEQPYSWVKIVLAVLALLCVVAMFFYFAS